ncbi:MAG TPA: hypothetical protein VFD58_15735 [Blastocatellia bacterium]|nr:hypothetical protein [Blastocatellia bacterium]
MTKIVGQLSDELSGLSVVPLMTTKSSGKSGSLPDFAEEIY